MHNHSWGAIQTARFSGEPSRPCTDPDCNHITLDLYLYCQNCCGPVSDPDESGEYHHIDEVTRAIDLRMDAACVLDVASGEAPYDEETEG